MSSLKNARRPAKSALFASFLAVTMVGLASGCSSSADAPSSAPPTFSASRSAEPAASAGSQLVGTWSADAGDILYANTANGGGPGGTSCTGRIRMNFTAEGQFTRSGRVECSVRGTSRSGAVASAGTYTTSGDTLTISGYRSTGEIPDSFGGGSATYAVAGDTLTITFDGGPAGTITQTYQRG